MGARIQARDGNYPPLIIQGGRLQAIQYPLPVASAQVKSAILLAGLLAEGETEVIEPAPTRNHTEVALKEFGAEVSVQGNRISLKGRQRLHAVKATVPGDISSAAFFLVAATLLPDSEIILTGVGLNPGRRAIVDLLREMGASIEILNRQTQAGEPVADLRVKSACLQGGTISGDKIPQVIADASCKVFGHLCPVFFTAEPLTETREGRRHSRSVPREVMLKVVRRDGQICQKCFEPVADNEVEFDHLIPFSKGGASTIENLRVVHRECNRRKKASLDEILSPNPLEHLRALRAKSWKEVRK